MAYLREQTKEVDIDFPPDSVWKAIHEAVDEFDWEILDQDEAKHQITIKTSDTLTSYGSTLKVKLKHNQNSTHMLVSGETPVTTITSTLQFGQTFDCIEDFVLALADIMNR